jgi:hypothetical protein
MYGSLVCLVARRESVAMRIGVQIIKPVNTQVDVQQFSFVSHAQRCTVPIACFYVV